jgi:hypothetical protein
MMPSYSADANEGNIKFYYVAKENLFVIWKRNFLENKMINSLIVLLKKFWL